MRTILKNGRCHTLNENNDIVEAILAENGKIAAVGTNEEIMKLAKDGDNRRWRQDCYAGILR